MGSNPPSTASRTPRATVPESEGRSRSLQVALLLILAAIWAGVVVTLVRDRVSERPGDSIGSFRNQLRVLQRTAPATVSPANTLRTPGAIPAARRSGPTPSELAHQRTLERRRQVFASLLAGMAITLLMGLVPALRPMLWVHLLLDVCFVAYVALLVNLRNQAAEREMKLRFLPGREQAVEPALLLRRSGS